MAVACDYRYLRTLGGTLQCSASGSGGLRTGTFVYTVSCSKRQKQTPATRAKMGRAFIHMALQKAAALIEAKIGRPQGEVQPPLGLASAGCQGDMELGA